MDFYLPDNIEKLRINTRNFVDKHLIPLESDTSSFDNHENINESLLNEIREKDKLEGLWSPQMPKSRSGLGLGPIGMDALYEEMNRSMFGKVCVNWSAKDEGKVERLNKNANK